MSDGAFESHRLVILPTYNEIANLAAIVGAIRRLQPDVHVLVVDDSSPDGTGELAERLVVDGGGRVHVLHRPAKSGLGAAYLAGFAWALARNFDVIVEMDADGSHDPRYLDDLFSAIEGGADLAIGSRYVHGGRVDNWPRHRWLLSRIANGYARLSLGTNVHDVTAGYRAYSRAVLESIDLGSIKSSGYCFQIELVWRAGLQNSALVEIPIAFANRRNGASKMRSRDLAEAMRRVTLWGFSARLSKSIDRVAVRPSNVSPVVRPHGEQTTVSSEAS